MEKFSSYKNSGVKWLGEIPEHWELSRLGKLLSPVSENNRADLPLLSITREKGVILRNLDDEEENHNFIPDDLSNYKLLEEGHFGMNKMKAWQGSYGIANYTGIVSPAYFIFKLTENIIPAYFHIAIRSKLYISFFGSASDGVRIGQWDLSKNRMKEIPFLVPTIDEQNAIAEFLDDKTAKIDQAITIKQKQIDLLKERRQILIHKAVTQGINPNVKLKDSGVEWIGEIPEHWEVKKLKNFVRIKGGFAFDSSKFKDEGVQIIKIANTYMNELCLDRQPTFVDLSHLHSHKDWIVSKNDILMSLTGTLGKKDYGFAILIDTDQLFLLNQRVAKIEVKDGFEASYILNILHSDMYLNQLYMLPSGTKQANLSNDNVINIKVAFPINKVERESILEFINKTNFKISTVISLKEIEIEKLKEYKTSLINGVVTGKVKVSE